MNVIISLDTMHSDVDSFEQYDLDSAATEQGWDGGQFCSCMLK